jgi:anaerobic selenocysteine-containing dehydrogenase
LLDGAPPPPDLPAPPARAGASAPLWLFSNSTEKSQASQWAGKGLGERLWVAVHPDAVPGIADGARVRIESVAGSLAAEVRHDAAQRRDVAIVPKGGHFDRGQSANAIIPAVATDLGLGAAYLDCLVRIVPE